MTDSYTTTNILEDHVTQEKLEKKVFQEVITNVNSLDRPEITKHIKVTNLRGRVPYVYGNPIIQFITELGVTSPISSSLFGHVDYRLQKSRVSLGITDEATIDENEIDSLSLQVSQCAQQLVDIKNMLIYKTLSGGVMKEYAWNYESENFFTILYKIIGDWFINHRVTACLMSPETIVRFFDIVTKNYNIGSSTYNYIPFTQIPIIPKIGSPNEILFVSSDLLPCIFVEGPRLSRTWSNNEYGGTELQIDTFSDAVAPNIMKEDIEDQTEKRASVCKVILV